MTAMCTRRLAVRARAIRLQQQAREQQHKGRLCACSTARRSVQVARHAPVRRQTRTAGCQTQTCHCLAPARGVAAPCLQATRVLVGSGCAGAGEVAQVRTGQDAARYEAMAGRRTLGEVQSHYQLRRVDPRELRHAQGPRQAPVRDGGRGQHTGGLQAESGLVTACSGRQALCIARLRTWIEQQSPLVKWPRADPLSPTLRAPSYPAPGT